MAGRIRQEDVEAVRERTDIVQVISGHLQLKKAGRDSLVGLCPFHTEKSPSFSVSPTKQVYYCFGCLEAGDVFKFMEKVESLSFVETVERLASAAGITLRYEGETSGDRKAIGRRQLLHKAIGEAAGLYQKMLLEGKEAADARAYVRSRGIESSSIERFGVGYAPGYPDFLLKRMSKTYSAELLVESGLVAKDTSGASRDRFRGRVMFPIHDLSGNAVGFGGRLLAGPGAPPNAAKYVNSPETPVYHKGSLLYNLNRAKSDLSRSGRAFLVEGYTDVIGLDQAGIHGAVATCGTALGEDHIRLLARFTEKVVLAFDSDEAGARAAERAFEFHERYPVELSVLVLPEGKDPADFVQALGAEAGEAIQALAERATPLVEYMIDRLLLGLDTTSPEAQTRAVRAVVERVLKHLSDPVLREKYAVLTADKIGRTTVSENAVLLELQRAEAPAEGPARPSARISPQQKVEREALKLLLQAPRLCEERLGTLDPEWFPTQSYRRAFELIRGAGGASANISGLVGAALELSRGDQMGKLIATLAVEPLLGDPTPDYVERIFLRLEEFALNRQVEELRGQVEKLNPLTSSDEHRVLFERFAKLEGARRRIREAGEALG
jgi:DNA primase